jgi:hypothetical protein
MDVKLILIIFFSKKIIIEIILEELRLKIIQIFFFRKFGPYTKSKNNYFTKIGRTKKFNKVLKWKIISGFYHLAIWAT